MNTPWKPILLSLSPEDLKEYLNKGKRLLMIYAEAYKECPHIAYGEYIKGVRALQLSYCSSTPLLIP